MINCDDIISLITSSCQIIPIIKQPDDLKDIDLSYSMIEIVNRSSHTNEYLSKLSNSNIVKSVGTVLSKEDVDMCYDNRIPIVFSPHFDIELVNYCKSIFIYIIPGVSNATEIMNAYNAGINIVKFFPCHCNDKIQELKQYSKVFQHLKLYYIVTGGVTIDTYKEILDIPNVIAVGSTSIKIIDNSING